MKEVKKRTPRSEETKEKIRQKLRKIEDLNEIRKCRTCLENKIITEFTRQGHLYRSICKACHAKKHRTGRPNTGWFKKGCFPSVPFPKGHIPWNKGKLYGNTRNAKQNNIWKTAVHERDGYKCVKCGNEKKLDTHHIKSWKDFPELRFDIDNGVTLCKICHGKEEGPINARNGLNTQFKKGHKLSPESIEKMKNTKRLRFLEKKD